MRRMFLWLAGCVCVVRGVFAADAVFSKDATHVYLCRYELKGLVDIDLKKKTGTLINLESTVDEQINSVALSNAGNILLATKSAVWAFDPVKAKAVHVCDTPNEEEMYDITYDPKTETVLVTTNKLRGYCLGKGSDTLKVIFNRRAPAMESPVFAENGTLFFAGHGDLWMGGIKPEPADSGVDRFGALFGFRCAPVAILETSDYNASSTGLHEIAISKGEVYGRFGRLGGSGWGDFIRFQRPAPAEGQVARGETFPDEKDFWSRAKTALANVETLADCSIGITYLCASQDGKRVFFLNQEKAEQSKVFLVQDDGKPEGVEIVGLAGVLGLH